MKTLVLLLAGPLQAWGTRSRFGERDTQPYPTRSGILGMLASARGVRRTDPVTEEWSGLSFLVRFDRPGNTTVDFHTVGGDYPHERRMRTASGGRNTHPMVTRRRYLTDAAFTVFVGGEAPVVDLLAADLAAPRWSPYLGRRSCPPAYPVLLGTVGIGVEEAAETVLLYRERPADSDRVLVRTARDAPDPLDADHWTDDVPVSRDPYDRRFASRPVVEDDMDLDADLCAGSGADAYRKIRMHVEEL